ncbi:HepT-like ribonuclease domain-containing protein [Phocaeicola faecalis]
MHKQELLLSILQKVAQSIERIIHNSENIDNYQYYYLTPAGMERLESTCMLLIAIGESIKGIDKLTNKQLFPQYPEIDWKGAMGIRDIIAHHYFDLDGEIVFNVVKENLPEMLECIKKIMDETTRLPHESMA